jgi:hypothetical protein
MAASCSSHVIVNVPLPVSQDQSCAARADAAAYLAFLIGPMAIEPSAIAAWALRPLLIGSVWLKERSARRPGPWRDVMPPFNRRAVREATHTPLGGPAERA